MAPFEYDGCNYTKEREENGNIYYKCSKYKSLKNAKCYARLTINPNGTITTSGTHTCSQQGQISGQKSQGMQICECVNMVEI